MQLRSKALAGISAFVTAALLILPGGPVSAQHDTGRLEENRRLGYAQAVWVRNGDIETVHVAGQVSRGEDFEDQVRGAYRELARVLALRGAGLADLVRTRTYVVGLSAERLGILLAVRKELFGETEFPASTVVGISRLAFPDYLVEIEGTAVLQLP